MPMQRPRSVYCALRLLVRLPALQGVPAESLPLQVFASLQQSSTNALVFIHSQTCNLVCLIQHRTALVYVGIELT